MKHIICNTLKSIILSIHCSCLPDCFDSYTVVLLTAPILVKLNKNYPGTVLTCRVFFKCHVLLGLVYCVERLKKNSYVSNIYFSKCIKPTLFTCLHLVEDNNVLFQVWNSLKMSALSSDALGGMNGAALGGGAALAGGLVAMTGRVGQLALRGITTYMRRKYLCKLETRDCSFWLGI